MVERKWKGQRIVIIGIARQGTALADYLVRRGAHVILSDQREQEELVSAREELAPLSEQYPGSMEWVWGGHPLNLLDRADLVCVSGGVPLEQPIFFEAHRRGIPLTNDSHLFMEVVPCKVIGITGSAGKTTTTSLVGRMAEAAFPPTDNLLAPRVWVGGNIGTPLISVVDQMKADDLAVVEFSSFQLELMERSPHIAAVLNITPNHLDRHGTMEAYREAKARILAYQTNTDTAVLCRDDPGSWGLRERVQGQLLAFGHQAEPRINGTWLHEGELIFSSGGNNIPLIPIEAVRLRGDHNLLNVLAACAIAHAGGIPVDAMRSAVEGFTGVPHRLEFVRTWGGAEWYNDSIATAPERSMAAIRSFTQPLVLLAGGRDKNLPWDAFADLVRQRVKHLILFGEAAGIIDRAVGENVSKTICNTMEEAVKVAARLVEAGDVVLLSPGGTSFDEFRDFEERGECFKRVVMQL